ncbi:MAG: alpha-L-fucosidase, partial [Phycisphaeraceae bacterium]|nr:alpha-L-fucosidase [Phycisphaeraceae bacterium]
MPESPDLSDKLEWFRDARLGMFVHWGMYAVLGRGEQILGRDLMPVDEYRPVADQFKPADDWAPRLARRARQAGMKYVVLTTRHHDGYCLFDTDTDDFNAVQTGPGRDLIAEYVQALRDEGLGVGFYYSLANWRWPGYFSPDRHPEDLDAMVEQVHAQVRELLTNYGPIDVLWYDGEQVPGSHLHGMWDGAPINKAPAEFWRAEELESLTRSLQPDLLINNRSGIDGDFTTPEQQVESPKEDRPWEACMTLNFAPGWGYIRHSLANKNPGEVLFHLVDAVRQGGNFLFNVGPDADGYIDDREGQVFDAVGRWLGRHGEAIYNTRLTGIYPTGGRVQGPGSQYGMWTGRGRQTYFTLFYYPGDPLIISKVAGTIESARCLTTDQPLDVKPLSNRRWEIGGLPDDPPDPLAPVVEVTW